ncbi:MAG: DUF4215 domain-containing protein [bacterium]
MFRIHLATATGLILAWSACASPPLQEQSDAGPDAEIPTYCGNQLLEAGEECDDGNLLNGDGCSPSCTVEDGWACSGEPSLCVSLCGNSTLDSGEECDGADLNGNTCTSIPGGYTSGTLACTAGCAFDTTGCQLASCGNGVVDAGEQCDDGNSSNNDACMNNCQNARCGDGYVHQGVEECDDGNSSNLDACLNSCDSATCGDGYVWTLHESCDDGNSSNTDSCLVGCIAASCGDGHVWAGQEDCDDSNTVAGDGCSPACAAESLPVLHWATGQPAVWGSMTLTYAGDTHAPSTPIVAAANVDQRNRAYVFTATTFHVLSLPGHQWIDSGALSSRFPGVPGSAVKAAWGVSWSTDTSSSVLIVTSQPGPVDQYYSYAIDNATGVFTPDPANPNLLDMSGDPEAPVPSTIKALYVDLANAHGWATGDPSTLCATGATTIGPYLGAITTANDIYINESGHCFTFYTDMAVAQFPPFTQLNAPVPAHIVAAFYSTEHGNRLYIISTP